MQKNTAKVRVETANLKEVKGISDQTLFFTVACAEVIFFVAGFILFKS